MASPLYTPISSSKKHKKHKSEKRERLDSPSDRPPGLKLILKVGNQPTPEHTTEFGYNLNTTSTTAVATHDDSLMDSNDPYFLTSRSHHKKSKKKKKKKDKNKDRERKHRHHHKEKKRKRDDLDDDENQQDFVSEIDNNGGSPSQQQLQREPRTCVLRQRQERAPLQKMLDQLLTLLEKKDPQQFFAWPVTDSIAPGYSSIITQPMDFSTMRQKIDDGQYDSLQDFINDFRLMCTNAMKYNHIDTIYYKASKKLLHAGMKMMQPEKLSWLINLIPDLTSDDLGFEITQELRQNRYSNYNHNTATAIIAAATTTTPITTSTNTPAATSTITTPLTTTPATHHLQDEHYDSGDQSNSENSNNNIIINNNNNNKRIPNTKFEAIPDDLTPEEILAKSQIAAREARAKLLLKRGGGLGGTMGYLKQRKDGTTNLNILVGGDGCIPGTKKRPILLGQLCGKLSDGNGQLHGYREDRRNLIKPVKPLYYGAFGSYAPSYDSTFSNLTKDESDLIYQTYGSEQAVQYAESILDFVKDNDYAQHLVDSLLDLLTGGDHNKTKTVIQQNKKLREEEETIDKLLNIKSYDKVKINKNDLLSLKDDLNIDIDFINNMDTELQQADEQYELQQQLNNMYELLEKLHKQQYQRLSQNIPMQSLNQCHGPLDDEIQLATNITENLTEIIKKVQPGDVAPIAGIRKALGVPQLPDLDNNNTTTAATTAATATATAAASTTTSGNPGEVADLELELRQFLESDPSLTQSPLRDDKTIEEILME